MSDATAINSLVIGLGSMAFGKERRAIRTFKHLHHVKPFFLTSKWEDGSVSRLLRQNQLDFDVVPFGYLGRAKLSWTLIAMLHMPILFIRMVRNYERQRCSVIVALTAGVFVNALPAIFFLKLFRGAKVVFYLGDAAEYYWVNRALARLINLFASEVIANSQSVKLSWSKVGVDSERISVVYNGVDIDRFETAVPQDFRSRFAWPRETVLIGFAGQFQPNKGVEDFVAAAELALEQNSDLRFLLIGRIEPDNSYLSTVVDRINSGGNAELIVFPGWFDNIETVLAGLDIVVVPSRHEDPAANINIEAMATGLPVIATRVGGSIEIVEDQVTGYLVDKRRPDLIADCLLQLAPDRALRKTLGSAGQARARKLFDIRTNSMLVEDLLINA
jgi:glycosyltransferase involved in cell wall biosynthesis